MSELWQVLLLSLLPGTGNFAGGLVAEFWKPSLRLLNWALHAASGILIAIVAVELIPRALDVLAGWWLAAAFAAGGVAYIGLPSVDTSNPAIYGHRKSGHLRWAVCLQIRMHFRAWPPGAGRP